MSEDKPTISIKEKLIQEISKTISERRQQRNISLDKVTQTLKIRTYFLECIESGKWSELPHEVYVRGFIRRYAQFLGLDGNELLAPYVKVHDELKSIEKTEDVSATSTYRTKMNFIWIGLGVCIMVGIVNYIHRSQPDPESYEEPAQNAEFISEPNMELPGKTEVKPLAEVVPGVGSHHKLLVFSSDPLWMRIQTETRSFEGFIPKKSTWVWKGEGKFSVHLGHTRQVALYFDGIQVELVGNQKSLTLPSNNASTQ